MREFIDIVFDGEGPESRFVEVEDERGFSIAVGEWLKRPDGYWALRLTSAAFDNDPTLWCQPCGAPSKRLCKCPPIADNE